MKKMMIVVTMMVCLLSIVFIQSASSETIRGCVNRLGTLRIVAPSASCKATEKELTWNHEGQPGGPGPKGDKGDPGPKGDPGAPGAPGSALSVFDSTNQRVGALIDFDGWAYNETSGFMIGFGDSTSLIFGGHDCTGVNAEVILATSTLAQKMLGVDVAFIIGNQVLEITDTEFMFAIGPFPDFYRVIDGVCTKVPIGDLPRPLYLALPVDIGLSAPLVLPLTVK